MIKEEMVFVGGNLKDKHEIITFLAKEAQKQQLIANALIFEEAVLAREAQISTSVGYNIAMPHGKSEVVNEAFIAYYKSKELFEWDADSKEMVHSIIMIGVPIHNGDKTHLKYISQVSKKLIDDSFREQLFECNERGKAFRLLTLINDELK